MIQPDDPIARLKACRFRGITLCQTADLSGRGSDHAGKEKSQHERQHEIEDGTCGNDRDAHPDRLPGVSMFIIGHDLLTLCLRIRYKGLISEHHAVSAERYPFYRIFSPIFDPRKDRRAHTDGKFHNAHAVLFCQNKMPEFMNENDQADDQDECNETDDFGH